MKKILIILVILVISLIVLSIYWQNQNTQNNDLIVVDLNGDTHKILVTSLRQIEIVTARDDTLKVWSLLEILKINKIDLESAKNISLHSSDGGKISLEKKEAQQSYIAYLNDNGKSYYRLIIPEDAFSQRWLKYINKITLE